MKNHNLEKDILVNSVFSKVYKKYDFMNDLMSFGVHRLWKRNMINLMNPQKNNSLIDVASGTGDVAKLFSEKLDNETQISCVEPNKMMLSEGKNKLRKFKNISWFQANAEKLPFKDETFDFYTISFGIRNVSNIDKSLKEAYRVLKVGGRFFCLEFSKIDNEIINLVYQNYSKLIPRIGEIVVGSALPYNYLIESINKFYDQDELNNKLHSNGFDFAEYKNLSNGIAAIHSGWKT